MKLKKLLATTAVGLVVVGGAAYLARDYLFLHLPGLLAPRVEPNHPVPWQQGPATATAAPDARAPNIIYILADDLGFNDITVNGGGLANGAVPTPNIDALLRQGVQFTNGYAGNATCSPTRAAPSSLSVGWARGRHCAPLTRVRCGSSAWYCACCNSSVPVGSSTSNGSACSYRACAATEAGVAWASGFMLSKVKPSMSSSASMASRADGLQHSEVHSMILAMCWHSPTG